MPCWYQSIRGCPGHVIKVKCLIGGEDRHLTYSDICFVLNVDFYSVINCKVYYRSALTEQTGINIFTFFETVKAFA